MGKRQLARALIHGPTSLAHGGRARGLELCVGFLWVSLLAFSCLPLVYSGFWIFADAFAGCPRIRLGVVGARPGAEPLALSTPFWLCVEAVAGCTNDCRETPQRLTRARARSRARARVFQTVAASRMVDTGVHAPIDEAS